MVVASWNVMGHVQKPDFVFRRNGRVHLNQQGRQFSRLLAAEVCASAAVMLDTPCSEAVWRVLANHCIRQFPLHFPSCASPYAITFQPESTYLGADFNHTTSCRPCVGLLYIKCSIPSWHNLYQGFLNFIAGVRLHETEHIQHNTNNSFSYLNQKAEN